MENITYPKLLGGLFQPSSAVECEVVNDHLMVMVSIYLSQ